MRKLIVFLFLLFITNLVFAGATPPTAALDITDVTTDPHILVFNAAYVFDASDCGNFVRRQFTHSMTSASFGATWTRLLSANSTMILFISCFFITLPAVTPGPEGVCTISPGVGIPGRSLSKSLRSLGLAGGVGMNGVISASSLVIRIIQWRFLSSLFRWPACPWPWHRIRHSRIR